MRGKRRVGIFGRFSELGMVQAQSDAENTEDHSGAAGRMIVGCDVIPTLYGKHMHKFVCDEMDT
ncbi:MAG: hypothetical protein PWP27_671 [Clostridiales bacterium]|nr:hypothetical protein [Clostridiales bacterium]MDK2932861.1 hypothetical protein [Clostridiales bacterium]